MIVYTLTHDILISGVGGNRVVGLMMVLWEILKICSFHFYLTSGQSISKLSVLLKTLISFLTSHSVNSLFDSSILKLTEFPFCLRHIHIYVGVNIFYCYQGYIWHQLLLLGLLIYACFVMNHLVQCSGFCIRTIWNGKWVVFVIYCTAKLSTFYFKFLKLLSKQKKSTLSDCSEIFFGGSLGHERPYG